MNAVGVILQKPLCDVVLPRAIPVIGVLHNVMNVNFIRNDTPLNTVIKVCVVAFGTFSAAVFFVAIAAIPGIAYLAGRAILCLRTPRLNYANLSLAPKPIQLPDEGRLHGEPLLQAFQDVCRSIGYHPGSYDNLRNVCTGPLSNALGRPELDAYLNEMLLILNNPATDIEKKRQVLIALNDAGGHCAPTWLETARREYQFLVSGQDSATEQVLSYVQAFKEEILQEFFGTQMGLTQWHGLNCIRQHLGQHWGLNRDVQTKDVFENYYPWMNSALVLGLIWLVLMYNYDNTQRLIDSVKASTARAGYNVKLYELLVKAETTAGRENATNYVAQHYYSTDDNYTLTDAGVIRLLQVVGVLC